MSALWLALQKRHLESLVVQVSPTVRAQTWSSGRPHFAWQSSPPYARGPHPVLSCLASFSRQPCFMFIAGPWPLPEASVKAPQALSPDVAPRCCPSLAGTATDSPPPPATPSVLQFLESSHSWPLPAACSIRSFLPAPWSGWMLLYLLNLQRCHFTGKPSLTSTLAPPCPTPHPSLGVCLVRSPLFSLVPLLTPGKAHSRSSHQSMSGKGFPVYSSVPA